MPDEKPKRENPPLVMRLTFFGLLAAIMLLVSVRYLNAGSLYPGVISDASVGPRVAKQRKDVREVRFETDDGLQLYGWVQGADSAPRKIIQFMGNGEFVGPSADSYAQTCEALNAQFLLFDYRGYANSQGRPNERGLYMDARAAWRFATTDLKWRPSQIILWGRSLGGAPAIKLATELIEAGTPPAALILEAPFASISHMARAWMSHLGKPDWLIYESYNNVGRAPGLTLPVFHTHSTTDEIIPFDQGLLVHEALPGPKEFLRFEGVGHNETWNDRLRANMIRERIDAFLKRHE